MKFIIIRPMKGNIALLRRWRSNFYIQSHFDELVFKTLCSTSYLYLIMKMLQYKSNTLKMGMDYMGLSVLLKNIVCVKIRKYII